MKLIKFGKWIDYGKSHPGVKISLDRAWCRSRDRCLYFNAFNISERMRWGQWGKAGRGVRATMLRSIPSLFWNDAWIYSEDAVLWHGVAGMSCFALPCYYKLHCYQIFCCQMRSFGRDLPDNLTAPPRRSSWILREGIKRLGRDGAEKRREKRERKGRHKERRKGKEKVNGYPFIID